MKVSTMKSNLPIKHDITRIWSLSLILAVLMGMMSLAGLIVPESVYTSEEQIQFFMANDVINLVLGLPILLLSMWLTRGGKLVGLLLWPGSLLYVLYNYIAYVVGMPFSILSFAYLAFVFLVAFTVFDLLRCLNQGSIQEQLAGAVYEKIAGWVLVGFGTLFIFRAIAMIGGAFINRSMLPISELGLLVADIALSVIWIAGGILLLQWKPLGYTSGLGLLFMGSMLFLGLILVLFLQPLLTNAQFVPVDVLVVFTMGMICFIPFGLFLRGVALRDRAF